VRVSLSYDPLRFSPRFLRSVGTCRTSNSSAQPSSKLHIPFLRESIPQHNPNTQHKRNRASGGGRGGRAGRVLLGATPKTPRPSRAAGRTDAPPASPRPPPALPAPPPSRGRRSGTHLPGAPRVARPGPLQTGCSDRACSPRPTADRKRAGRLLLARPGGLACGAAPRVAPGSPPHRAGQPPLPHTRVVLPRPPPYLSGAQRQAVG